jgi:hypothetical protein
MVICIMRSGLGDWGRDRGLGRKKKGHIKAYSGLEKTFFGGL